MNENGWNQTYNWVENVNDDVSIEDMSAYTKLESQGIIDSDVVIILLPVGKEAHVKFGMALALNKVYNGLKVKNTIFKKYGKDVKEKPLVEKLKMLFNDISDSNFNSTDFISYIANIKHELFTNNELDWNLKINFIGKKDEEDQYPVALFSVNTNDIKNVKENTVQYLYDSHKKVY